MKFFGSTLCYNCKKIITGHPVRELGEEFCTKKCASHAELHSTRKCSKSICRFRSQPLKVSELHGRNTCPKCSSKLEDPRPGDPVVKIEYEIRCTGCRSRHRTAEDAEKCFFNPIIDEKYIGKILGNESTDPKHFQAYQITQVMAGEAGSRCKMRVVAKNLLDPTESERTIDVAEKDGKVAFSFGSLVLMDSAKLKNRLQKIEGEVVNAQEEYRKWSLRQEGIQKAIAEAKGKVKA